MARKEFETLTPQMFYILLALYKPMHGYDIMQKVKELTSGEIQIGAGTLYSLLPRFEQEYYIRLVKEENKRKIYQITKNGKEKLRQEKAYGEQKDYFDNPNFIGWTRRGDEAHLKSGLAAIISNAGDGEKRMYIGEEFANSIFIDSLNNCEDEIQIDNEGYGNFKVKTRSTSIWVEK